MSHCAVLPASLLQGQSAHSQGTRAIHSHLGQLRTPQSEALAWPATCTYKDSMKVNGSGSSHLPAGLIHLLLDFAIIVGHIADNRL